MDKMRQRFGADKVGRAVAMGIHTRQFNPFKG
jgi:hypothetical protein